MATSLEPTPSAAAAAPVPEKLALDEAALHGTGTAKKSFLGTKFGKLVLGSVVIVPILAGVGFWFSMAPSMPPEEKLKLALKVLEEAADEPDADHKSIKIASAREAALALKKIDYRDPAYPWGVEYILGMTAFYEALTKEEAFQEQLFLVAIQDLRAAEERGVPPEPGSYRKKWAYAISVSLCRVGLASEAQPILLDEIIKMEKIFSDSDPEMIEAKLLRADYELAVRTPESLKEANKYNEEAFNEIEKQAKPDHVDPLQVRVRLQRVQIKLAMKKGDEAKEALAWVQDKLEKGQVGDADDYESKREIKLLLAQTLLEDGRTLRENNGSVEKVNAQYQAAIEMLKDLARNGDLDQSVTRQAAYLRGVCLRELGDTEGAVSQFHNVSMHGASQEATAARVAAGDVLRMKGGHDGDALTEYGLALRSVQSLDAYRNRWMDQQEFQQAIRNAWEAWITDKRFDRAIALAELMPPLFPQEIAYEYAAIATQRWAESKQEEFDKSSVAHQQEIWEEVRRRWNRSGQAHEKLAQSLSATVRYGDALWTSAEHYVRGQQHLSALQQLDAFIETRPTRFLPTALVYRGKTLMSLGRHQDAIKSFEEVIANHSTDVAALQAEYLIGLAYLEQDDRENAEKRWEQILQNPKLTPDAIEWQQSLLGVTRIRFQAAEEVHAAAEAARQTARIALQGERLKEADQKYATAIGNFEQYLSRYPHSESNPEVMYELAIAYQHSADLYRWARADALNENARIEATEALSERLTISHSYYQKAIEAFENLREDQKLTELGQGLLRNSYFSTGDVLVLLEKYQDAIEAYTKAANRYPRQSDTLQAYVQVATCYEKLLKPAEAQSMIEQAKVILRDMPTEIFDAPSSQMSKTEWERRLQWFSENMSRS